MLCSQRHVLTNSATIWPGLFIIILGLALIHIIPDGEGNLLEVVEYPISGVFAASGIFLLILINFLLMILVINLTFIVINKILYAIIDKI